MTPDADMLADPDIEYPVYIDPTFTGALLSYANLHQQSPNQTMLMRGGELRVGVQTWNSSDWTYGRWRAAVRFNTSALADRYISSATVQAVQTHMGGCEDRYMRLWQVAAITGSSTTWNNVNYLNGGYLQSVLVKSSNSGCGSGNQTVKFSNSNVKQVVQKHANKSHASISFLFQSSNETVDNGQRAWRKLSRSSAKLVVDHRPKSSTGLKTDGKNCSTSGPGPWVPSTTPTLSAVAPEFTGSSGWLRFHLYTPTDSGNFRNWWVSASSGKTVTTSVPSGALTAGNTYRWRVLAYDTQGGSAAWQDMSRCWFRVNSAPQTPNGLSTEGLGCSTDRDNPTLVTTTTPKLTATPRDPDGIDGGNVEARFRFYQQTGDNIKEWSVAGPPGTAANTRVSSDLVTADGLYRWRVITDDTFTSSAWSSYCWLEVDTSAPEPPDAVQVTTDPAPSTAVEFDLVGGSDVAGFKYGIQGQSTTTTAADDTVTRVSVTPPSSSPDHVLQVWAIDAAGNESSRTDVWFTTTATAEATAVGAWRFDGDWLDDAGDNDLSPTGTPSFVSDQAGRSEAAVETGTGSCVVADGPIVDATASYTLAAWVRVDAAVSAEQAVLDVTGRTKSNLKLSLSSNGRWNLSASSADSTEGTWINARAASSATQYGSWTHVVGVYDASAERIRLYLNGSLHDSVAVPFEPWSADGVFSVGCGAWASGNTFNPLTGAVDDAIVYQSALTGGQIADLVDGYGMPAAQQAWWPLRGDGDDHSGRAAELTAMPNTPVWLEDQHGRAGSALELDGTACPTASTVPVRTDAAFTVSAWVRLDADHVNSHPRVFSFEGNEYFSVMAKYNAETGKWNVSVTAEDTPSASWGDGAISTEITSAEAWAHIAVTVDPDHDVLQLYVNGELSDTGTISSDWSPWRANAFVIGCGGTDQGGYYGQWDGAVTDVRVWRGVANADTIAGAATEALAYWELDESIGGTDPWGGHDLSFTGTHEWAEDRFNDCFAAYGLGLDGDGYAHTVSAVVTTDESFTVATWVKLTDKDGHRTAVSQTGTDYGAFNLNYHAEYDRFQLSMPQMDAPSAGGWTRVLAEESPVLDELDGTAQWYHLAGVVDLGSGTIRLYVDGDLQGQAPIVDSPWHADGPMTIGSAEQLGQMVNPMIGMIDQVYVYQGVVDELEIDRWASNRPIVPIHPDGSCEEEPPPIDL